MSHEYQVLNRVERLRSAVFTVVTDQVVMPGGLTAARDYLLHPGAVGVVALDESDRVVLIHQYRHPVGRRLWELPAGLIDVPGEALLDAAARELAEEVDLTAARWDLLVDAHTTPGCSNEMIRLYLARQLTPVAAGLRHERVAEESELNATWVDLDDAVTMALSGEITNAACAIGVLAAAQARARGWSTLRPVDEPLNQTSPAGSRTP